jgi:hypothetical protein
LARIDRYLPGSSSVKTTEPIPFRDLQKLNRKISGDVLKRTKIAAFVKYCESAGHDQAASLGSVSLG